MFVLLSDHLKSYFLSSNECSFTLETFSPKIIKTWDVLSGSQYVPLLSLCVQVNTLYSFEMVSMPRAVEGGGGAHTHTHTHTHTLTAVLFCDP